MNETDFNAHCFFIVCFFMVNKLRFKKTPIITPALGYGQAAYQLHGWFKQR